MRDSFVFHADYICDLPDEYKTRFAMYAINYALNDERPQLEGLELSLWKKIARRIDTEAAKYRDIQEKRREAARKRYADKQKNQEEVQSKKKFEKPSVEEVEDYCKERKNEVNARSFFDFYESKGWKVGTAKMKDWKACVRTWEQRQDVRAGPVPDDKILL